MTFPDASGKDGRDVSILTTALFRKVIMFICKIRHAVTAAIVLTLTAASLQARPMIDHVPHDAVAYITWQGSTKIGSRFDDSRMAGLLAEPQSKAMFAQLTRLGSLWAEDEYSPEMGQFIIASSIMLHCAKHPMTGYVVLTPKPHLVLAVHPDDDAREGLLEELRRLAQSTQGRVRVDAQDDLLVVQVASRKAASLKLQKQAASLASHTLYQASLQHADTDAPLFAFVDVQAVLRHCLEKAAGNAHDEDADRDRPAADVFKAYAASGVDGVTSLTVTADFIQKDWVMDVRLNAPAPRRGLMTVLDQASIAQADLEKIPATADSFAAFSIDVPHLVNGLRDFGVAMDANAARMYETMLGMGGMAVGINVQQDIVDAIGPTWIVYTDPTMPRQFISPAGGVINKLRNPSGMKHALSQARRFIQTFINQNDDMESYVSFRPVFQTIQYRGMEVESCYLVIFSIHWTVADGHLLVSTTPQGLAKMHKAITHAQHNIMTREDVRTLLQRVDLTHARGVGFIDLPEVAPQGYYFGTTLSQIMANDGFSDEPVQVDLPALDVVLRHLSLHGSALRVDDTGFALRTIAPFPASESLAVQLDSFFMLAGTYWLGQMATDSYTDEYADGVEEPLRAVRGIYTGIQLHNAQHPGQSPTLARLFEADYLPASYFLSPDAPAKRPSAFSSWDKQQQASWIEQHASYVLVTPNITKLYAGGDNAGRIIVFQKPAHAEHDAPLVVSWGDGRSTREPASRVAELLLQQTGQTMQQLVDAQAGSGR